LHGRGAVGVGPDDEVDVRVADGGRGAAPRLGGAAGGRRPAGGGAAGVGRGGGAGPTAGAEGQGGNTRDGSSAERTLVHGFSFEARWHTPPPVPRNLARSCRQRKPACCNFLQRSGHIPDRTQRGPVAGVPAGAHTSPT